MKIPRDVIIFLNFGWTSAITMGLFSLGGAAADKKWDTSPWCLLGGSLLGAMATVVLFVSSLKKMDRFQKGEK